MKDPIGFITLRNHVRARQEHRWPSFLVELLESAGKDVHTAWHRVFTQRMFYTRDPENIKTILSAPSDHYVLGSSRGANFAPVAGDGLFTADGQAWQHYRACTRPFFTHTKQQSFLETLENSMQQRWRSLSAESDGWTKSVELQSFFLDMTLDAWMDTLFGHSQADLSMEGTNKGPDTPSRDAFAASLDAAGAFVGDRTVFGKFYWIKHSRNFHSHCETIRAFIDHHIDSSCTYKDFFGTSNDDGGLRSDEGTKIQYHQDELRNRVQPLLFTGRNPGGALLAIMFFYMARNPPIYSKLRKETLATFGPAGDVTLANLDTCQYLQFFILESLRLSNVVPAIMRSAEKDLVLPIGGGSDKLSPICVPKEQLAMNQAAYVVTRFLQRFESIQIDNDTRGESTVKHATDISTKFIFNKRMKFLVASDDTNR
ncbi:MAG: hypothetical protein Q9205_003161 [Flavoplaca limonia]